MTQTDVGLNCQHISRESVSLCLLGVSVCQQECRLLSRMVVISYGMVHSFSLTVVKTLWSLSHFHCFRKGILQIVELIKFSFNICKFSIKSYVVDIV